jgi:tetratricopeptide (TPR) repeat protein
MWNLVMCRSSWVGWVLAAVMLCGCAGKQDPYTQQVQRVTSLSQRGEQWFSQGDFKRADRDFTRSLELSRAVDYPQGVALQLNNLAAIALEQGDLEKAGRLLMQAWELNRDLQNWEQASTNQANLATVAQKSGDLGKAEEHLRRAQEAAQRSGAKPALARIYCRWASLYLDQQQLAPARDFLEKAKAGASTSDLQGAWQYQWGRLCLLQGNTEAAVANFTLALESDRKILDRGAMAADLLYLGQAYQARGDAARAFYFYGRAFDVYVGLGKKTQLRLCLERLRQVNSQGNLRQSLERFEKHPQLQAPPKTSSAS